MCPPGTFSDVWGEGKTCTPITCTANPIQHNTIQKLMDAKPPFGINIFSQYDSTTKLVPNARGGSYDVAVGQSPTISHFPPHNSTIVFGALDLLTIDMTISNSFVGIGTGVSTLEWSSVSGTCEPWANCILTPTLSPYHIFDPNTTSTTGVRWLYKTTSHPGPYLVNYYSLTSHSYVKRYRGSNYIEPEYKGDWFKFTSPWCFTMKSSEFVGTLNDRGSRPGEFKIYARNNDDDEWVVKHTQTERWTPDYKVCGPGHYDYCELPARTNINLGDVCYFQYAFVVKEMFRPNDGNKLSFVAWNISGVYAAHVVTTPVGILQVENPVKSLYGSVGTTWTLPALPAVYTRCWAAAQNRPYLWNVECITNGLTAPFAYVIDQVDSGGPTAAVSITSPTSANYIHSMYTWDVSLNNTEMKIVTAAIRNEIGGLVPTTGNWIDIDTGKCNLCPVGTYGVTDETGLACMPCPTGTYGDTMGATACILAATTTPESTTSTTTPEVTTSTTTPEVTTSTTTPTPTPEFCPPGQYRRDNRCEPCAPEDFKALVGNDMCTPCPVGMSTIENGGISTAMCVCDMGFFGAANSKCQACPVDTYNPLKNTHWLESCHACPYKMHQPFTGQSKCVSRFVELSSTVDPSSRVVGLFVHGDTSCAYITSDSSSSTDKVCWGQLTATNPALTSGVFPLIPEACGDGVLHPILEQCDDGNYFDGDGCSYQCTIENGFFCEPRSQMGDSIATLWFPSTCCRISDAPPSHAPTCTSCDGRVSPYPGVRFQHDCRLLDVDECVEIPDVCALQTGGVVCSNLDATSNGGVARFDCVCPPGLFLSDGKCTSERFVTRLVLDMNQVEYPDIKHRVQVIARHEAESVIGEVSFLGVRVDQVGGLVVCMVFVDSWEVMQELTSHFNTTRLIQRLSNEGSMVFK